MFQLSTKKHLGDAGGSEIVRRQVQVSFGFWSKLGRTLFPFQMESGIRLMLAPRLARAKHSFISGKSHGPLKDKASSATSDETAGVEELVLTLETMALLRD
ncbi:hypothetical protein Tco_1110278 [Tanacetum coccineum]|uniref:Uncharacterized protein n=1 Tax=Tanacetum coccineum TaxID=301880 RepID=A0ABQ5IIE7_9ASTR